MKLVGLTGICDYTGLPCGTIDVWRHRGKLPAPEETITDWWANHA